MRRVLVLACLLTLTGCRGAQRDPGTIVFLIESSPANLDPRIGADAQSQRIDALLFDGLVARNASFQFTPALAESWEQPNPLTLVFHLRGGVRFHDGRALTARDVVWTIESMIDPMLPGAVISPRANSFAAVSNVEAPDDRTVIFHLKHADNFLLANLSTGGIGIVPEGSGRDFWQHPVGTGPFRFVSQQIDQDVVVERNPQSWAAAPKIERVRFAVVPDAITRSLELEKGSGDVAVNSLPIDSLPVLGARPNLRMEETAARRFNIWASTSSTRCSRMRGCARRLPAPSTGNSSSRHCWAAMRGPHRAYCRPITGRGPAMLRATISIRRGRPGCWTRRGTGAASMESAFA